jgi:hypothetical protein
MYFLRFALGLAAVVFSVGCFAAGEAGTPIIFDVRINLPLEPTEPVYHDFYINTGAESGLKKGMFILVVRPVPIHDPVQNKQQGILSVNVARLKVIHVERQMAVARLQTEFTDEDRPVLEFESVMIGDRIDLASAVMEPPTVPKSKAAPKAGVRRGQPAGTGPVVDARESEAVQPEAPAVKPPSKAVTENTTEVANSERPIKKVPSEAEVAASSSLGEPAVPPAIGARENKSEKASPATGAPDMVRIPVPTESTQTM